MFKRTEDIVKVYTGLEVARRARLVHLWTFIRGESDPGATRTAAMDRLRETGVDPTPLRKEWNLALAMGPRWDEGEHPYCFTPQMQSAMGKVCEAADCDPTEAWELIRETFPTESGETVMKRLPEVTGEAGPDAIDRAIALLRENSEDPRVIEFLLG